MVTKGLNKITQNETQDLQLVDNFCKSWDNKQNTLVNQFDDKLLCQKNCRHVLEKNEWRTRRDSNP